MLDVKVVQGNSLEIRFKVTDPNGSAIDFSSWEITEILWVVKESADSSDVELEKRLTQMEIVVSDGAEGQFIVTLQSADLDTLTGNYFHEATLYTADGGVYTVVVDEDMDLAKFIVRKKLPT